MAIRLRYVKQEGTEYGHWIAICSARSVAKEGDVYLDDNQHSAVFDKAARDFNSNKLWEDVSGNPALFELPYNREDEMLVDIEEDNNSNRDAWEHTYGMYAPLPHSNNCQCDSCKAARNVPPAHEVFTECENGHVRKGVEVTYMNYDWCIWYELPDTFKRRIMTVSDWNRKSCQCGV